MRISSRACCSCSCDDAGGVVGGVVGFDSLCSVAATIDVGAVGVIESCATPLPDEDVPVAAAARLLLKLSARQSWHCSAEMGLSAVLHCAHNQVGLIEEIGVENGVLKGVMMGVVRCASSDMVSSGGESSNSKLKRELEFPRAAVFAGWGIDPSSAMDIESNHCVLLSLLLLLLLLRLES